LIINSGDSQDAFALIKFFSKKEHYQWFKDGYSMFRTPHYYRRCEDAGRGDRSESCIGYWDSELGDKMPKITMNRRSFDLEGMKSLLLYPSQEVSDSWMQSWCVIGKYNDFELSLSAMLEEFGCYFVVLPAQNIKEYVSLLGRASGLNVSSDLIGYSENPFERSLSIKDKKFMYQKEFRFYVGVCGKYETEDKELHVTGLSSLLHEAGSLKFTSPKGDVRYCSVGNKEVVLASA